METDDYHLGMEEMSVETDDSHFRMQATNLRMAEMKDYLLVPMDALEPLNDSIFIEWPDPPEPDTELDDVNITDNGVARGRRRGGRRHKGQFMRRPMAMSEVIEELKNIDLRENALRCLSAHLIEQIQFKGRWQQVLLRESKPIVILKTKCFIQTYLEYHRHRTRNPDACSNCRLVPGCARVLSRAEQGHLICNFFLIVFNLPHLAKTSIPMSPCILSSRRKLDNEFYRNAGYFLYYSCGTVAILLQEMLQIYDRMCEGNLKVRGSKRLANVLTLLQSMAANEETRCQFVRARIPNYMLPIILSERTDEVYENVRAISLSVIGIICQAREHEVIKWAIESKIVEACFHALEIGSELSKVIAMTILESILSDGDGILAICGPSSYLLQELLDLCADMVSLLGAVPQFSPRLIFLVVRCYILLSQNPRALELLKNQLPAQLQDATFNDLKKEFPRFHHLRHQLLINTDKAKSSQPSAHTSPKSQENSRASPLIGHGKENIPIVRILEKLTDDNGTPMRPVDLNKQDWCATARRGEVM